MTSGPAICLTCIHQCHTNPVIEITKALPLFVPFKDTIFKIAKDAGFTSFCVEIDGRIIYTPDEGIPEFTTNDFKVVKIYPYH
jgi:hypothetical protein